MARWFVPLALCAAIPARADTASSPAPRVAIIPGFAVNLDSARVDALCQDLAEALAAELEVDAVGGLEVRRELPADGVPPDCTGNATCIADVAKRTGAQQLLFVVMVDNGSGAVQIDSTWVDGASGKKLKRSPIDLSSTGDAEAKAKFQTVAHQLLPDAKVRAKPTTGGGNAMHARMSDEVPRHFTTASIATGVAAGAGLAWTLGWGAVTRSKYDSCQSHSTTCTPSQRQTIRTDAAIADAGLVVFVGAAIASTVLYFTSGESSHVIVTPTAEGAAATLVGRF